MRENPGSASTADFTGCDGCDIAASLASNFVGQISQGDLIGFSAVGYLLICAALSRDPKPGIFGGLIAAIAVAMVLRADENCFHWGCRKQHRVSAAAQFAVVRRRTCGCKGPAPFYLPCLGSAFVGVDAR